MIKEMIDTFLEQHPNERWRHAHIVLEDYNLYDEHIEFCINYVDDEGKPIRPETKEFLLKLLDIPEHVRIEDD